VSTSASKIRIRFNISQVPLVSLCAGLTCARLACVLHCTIAACTHGDVSSTHAVTHSSAVCDHTRRMVVERAGHETAAAGVDEQRRRQSMECSR
jgi:hypothetical protein